MAVNRSALLLAGTLLLGGCATTSGGGAQPNVSLTQVQQLVVTLCAFQPTINTVAQIAATFGGPGAVVGEAVAEKIASAICAAVKPPGTQLRRMVVTPVVNGVPVHGKFMKRR